MIGATFVWKTYKKAANKWLINAPTGAVQVLDINKFAFWAFNCFVYDCEIIEPLIANKLLDLPEFYTPNKTIRGVNLYIFYCRFVKVIFEENIEADLADDFICFRRL